MAVQFNRVNIDDDSVDAQTLLRVLRQRAQACQSTTTGADANEAAAFDDAVLVTIGSHHFKIAMKRVKVVRQKPLITVLPAMPPFISGVMISGDDAIVVVDLAVYLGVLGAETRQAHDYVVHLQYSDYQVGIGLSHLAEWQDPASMESTQELDIEPLINAVKQVMPMARIL